MFGDDDDTSSDADEVDLSGIGFADPASTLGAEKASSDDPDWLDGIGSSPSIDEDDIFAAMQGGQTDNSDVEWLGDLGEDDFEEIDSFDDFDFPDEPVTSAPPQVMSSKPTETTSINDDFQDVLSDILGDERVDAQNQVVVDDFERGVLDQQAGTDISDLFEGVDDEFLEALSSAEPLGAVEEAPSSPESGGVFQGPDWLEDLRPDAKIRLGAGGLELEFDQRPLSTLDDDVRNLRETAIEYVQESSDQDSQDQEVIDSGTLAGVSGGLGVLDAPVPDEIALPMGVNITEQQAQRIQMLDAALEVVREEMAVDIEDDMFGDDEAPKPKPKPKARRRRKTARAKIKPDRLLVAVIVLAAVIAPFFLDSLHIGNDPDLDNISAQQGVVLAAMSSLQRGDRVLVAFEYGPTAAGELNPLAEAVLRDIFSQGAVPILISTNPLGAINGRYIIDELAMDDALLDAIEKDELLPRQDYFTLRYISGGAVAIRALTQAETSTSLIFATDTNGEATNLDVGTLDAEDFALVYVIGESSEDIRNWAEQFDVEGLPKLALVTTALEPIANAYVDPDGDSGYMGYLAGYRDTYRYNELRNSATRATTTIQDSDLPDTALSQWHSLTIGSIIAGAIIAFGTIINLLRSIRRRR